MTPKKPPPFSSQWQKARDPVLELHRDIIIDRFATNADDGNVYPLNGNAKDEGGGDLLRIFSSLSHGCSHCVTLMCPGHARDPSSFSSYRNSSSHSRFPGHLIPFRAKSGQLLSIAFKLRSISAQMAFLPVPGAPHAKDKTRREVEKEGDTHRRHRLGLFATMRSTRELHNFLFL